MTFNVRLLEQFPFRIDPRRLETQFEYNEPVRFDQWNSSSVPFSSNGILNDTVRRETYVPTNVEVNYADGSNDKKWSCRDFPLTKDIVVNNKKKFGNHSLRPKQREVINANMTGYDVFVLMPTGGGKSLTYQHGHKAAIYHGNMDAPQHAYVQKQWSKDEINIICATVAFGMGINKPDVRFVIHHSLPKPIEGCHQISYCENDADCRRYLQLVHFGEKFDSVNCMKTWDSCSKCQSRIDKDVTGTAKQLVEPVKMTGQHFSSAHILEVFWGSLNQFVKKLRHDILSMHGAGKHLAKAEASRVLHYLVSEDILMEEVKKSDTYGSVSSV